jgi:hypothetical protein
MDEVSITGPGEAFRIGYVDCTLCAASCMVVGMERLNITLDDEQAEKLMRLAGRMHIQPGTIARSLLSSALDDTDPDARNVAELLDGISGAYERAQLGLRQAQAGETISVNEL